MVSAEDLQVLCALAMSGSLKSAGDALGVSQQAASARMRHLEESLHLVLCDRSATGTRLTENGEVVAGWAGDVLSALNRLMEGASSLGAAESHTLTVMASLTIAEYLLPRWLTRLRARDLHSQVHVSAVNSARVIDGVRRGEAQLGFIETPAPATGLRTRRIASDELVVVAAADHPWARRSAITARELAATPLVVRERGSGTRDAMERALGDRGVLVGEPAAELPTSAAIRTAVIQGLAPAVLSVLTVREDIQYGYLVRVPLEDVRIVRELRAVWHPDSDLSQTARLLLALARSTP